MSLFMFTVKDLFYPDSPDNPDIVPYEPLGRDRFYAVETNFIQYHRYVLVLTLIYYVFDAYIISFIWKCCLLCKLVKPKKEFD